jgi:predicted ATPase
MSKNLQRIYIEGYKSIQLADVDIKNLNILIGANGSGKSNFISVFSFLRNVIEQKLQSVVREKGGADRLFFLGGKNTEEIKISLDFQPNYYNLILKPTLTDSLFIEAEQTGFQNARYNSPNWESISAGENESNLKKAAKSKKNSKYVYDTLFNWRVYHFHDTSDSAKAKKQHKSMIICILKKTHQIWLLFYF